MNISEKLAGGSENIHELEERLLKELGLKEPPKQPEDEEPFENTEYPIAEFNYRDGHVIQFAYDERSNDLSISEEGKVNSSVPILFGKFDSILDAYLAVTPANFAVPEELLQERIISKNYRAKIKDRPISTGLITTDQLGIPPTSSAGQSCFSTYYPWWDFHEAATPGMNPKTFYASSYTSKKQRYSQSYILNCAPSNYPNWLWARHRIYYKNALGNYIKHFDNRIRPFTWQAKTKGSVRRWRRISYSDAWNSSPANPNLKYTREGRFIS